MLANTRMTELFANPVPFFLFDLCRPFSGSSYNLLHDKRQISLPAQHVTNFFMFAAIITPFLQKHVPRTKNQTNHTNQTTRTLHNLSIQKLKIAQHQFFVGLLVPSLYYAKLSKETELPTPLASPYLDYYLYRC